MALWEVRSTRPGFDLTLRALPDGEPVTVGGSYALLAALAPGPLPELVNTEREPVVLCTARYAVAPGTWEALARDHEDDGDELIELVDIRGDLVQRGRLRQVDDEVELSTNSVERLARLAGRLSAVDPYATLLEQTAVPTAELMTGRAVLPAIRLPAALGLPG